MARNRFRFGNEALDETLAINKLNKPSNDEFDELHATVKARLESEKEDDADTDTDPEGDGDNEDGLPPVDNEASANDDLPEEVKEDGETDKSDDKKSDDDNSDKETDAALESLFSYHTAANQLHVGTEDAFTQDHLLTGSKILAESNGGVGESKKKFGFEYSGVMLKHVFKGVLTALGKTLKAIASGVFSIIDFIERRLNSYDNFKEKIAKARETLDLVMKDRDDNGSRDEDADPGVFTDLEAIHALKVGEDLDFANNIKSALRVNDDFFKTFAKSTVSSIISVRYILRSVVNNNTEFPSRKLTGNIKFPGFGPEQLEGYESPSDLVITCAHQSTLPGDIKFMAYLPSETPNTYEDICKSLQQSKMFMGFTDGVNDSVKECKYASPEEIKQILDLLDKICDKALASKGMYDEIVAARKSLNNDFKLYIRHLLTAKNKISIRDSFAQLISNKIEFTDRTFITGSFKLHDYNVQLLTAGLDYVRASIKTLA